MQSLSQLNLKKNYKLVYPCMQMLWESKLLRKEIKKVGKKNAFTYADKNFARSLL